LRVFVIKREQRKDESNKMKHKYGKFIYFRELSK